MRILFDTLTIIEIKSGKATFTKPPWEILDAAIVFYSWPYARKGETKLMAVYFCQCI